MDNITIVSIVENKDDLQFYQSIRKFYSKINVLIVNLSQNKLNINDKNTTIIENYKNIGKGHALHLGIYYASKVSKYMVLIDTKVEILKNGAIELLYFEIKGHYGVGEVKKTDDLGQHNKDGAISTLMTSFCMINVEEYLKYPCFVNYPVPQYKAMNVLNKNNLQHKLKHIELNGYIKNNTPVVRFIDFNEQYLNW